MTVTAHRDSPRCLVVYTNYNLQWKSQPPDRNLARTNDSILGVHLKHEPIFICPHMTVFQLYFFSGAGVYGRCHACRATATIKISDSCNAKGSRPPHFIIRAKRLLGGPDCERWGPWYFNSRSEWDMNTRVWYREQTTEEERHPRCAEEPFDFWDEYPPSPPLGRRMDRLKASFQNLLALRLSFPPLRT
ncbi:hypothetical protein BJX70DRAFT_398814 [Aspergillus crustosus]